MSGETQFYLAAVRTEIPAGPSKGGFPPLGVLARPVFLAGLLSAG